MSEELKKLALEIKILIRMHVIQREGGIDYSKLQEQIFDKLKSNL